MNLNSFVSRYSFVHNFTILFYHNEHYVEPTKSFPISGNRKVLGTAYTIQFHIDRRKGDPSAVAL